MSPLFYQLLWIVLSLRFRPYNSTAAEATETNLRGRMLHSDDRDLQSETSFTVMVPTTATNIRVTTPPVTPVTAPPLIDIVYLGNNGNPADVYPLPACAGDCDTDSDCQEGLFCYQRDGNEEIPGCNGGADDDGNDYCVYDPSMAPSDQPSNVPSSSIAPSDAPSEEPSVSQSPSHLPSLAPSDYPTGAPSVSASPSNPPSISSAPTMSSQPSTSARPSYVPSNEPSQSPSSYPTKTPTKAPTKSPTRTPTKFPTKMPTNPPTKSPTNWPTKAPTQFPTPFPTNQPTPFPTPQPTTRQPTAAPVSGSQVRHVCNDDDCTSLLSHCEGDCDSDSDCAGGMTCWQRGSFELAPGCIGGESFPERTDVCVYTWDLPTPAPVTPEPTMAPVPVPPGSFKLKLYWEDGYRWQDEREERRWCIYYNYDRSYCYYNNLDSDDCESDRMYIDNCDENHGEKRFQFLDRGNGQVQIKTATEDRCWARYGRRIYLEGCDIGQSNQRWSALGGSFGSYRFEISQNDGQCVANDHHPKEREVVEMHSCQGIRDSDTSFWNREY